MASALDDFLDMLTQTVVRSPFVTRDSYGKATYGAAVTYQARVTFKNRLVRNAAGEQVVARGRAWLATEDAVSTLDKLQLPDGSFPPLLNVDRTPDETGAFYVAVDFA